MDANDKFVPLASDARLANLSSRSFYCQTLDQASALSYAALDALLLIKYLAEVKEDE